MRPSNMKRFPTPVLGYIICLHIEPIHLTRQYVSAQSPSEYSLKSTHAFCMSEGYLETVFEVLIVTMNLQALTEWQVASSVWGQK
jgi:hypothetical protein